MSDLRTRKRRVGEFFIEVALFLCAALSILTTVGIIFVLFTESVYSFGESKAFFQEVSPVEFFTGTEWAPIFHKKYGALPLISATIMVAGIATLIGVPIGVLTAIYLSEYASPTVRSWIKPFLEILAGIPTVVYGYFGLAFITPYILVPIFHDLMGLEVKTYNALSAGIVVAIMIIPMVSSLSEDAIRAVPRSLREAGYALGSTKFEVCVKIVLPAAFSGIMASFLLAISRAIGETMAVTMAGGNGPNLTVNPLESVQTMTAYIVSVSQGDTPVGSIEYKSIYAVGLTLFCMTFVMNILSHWVMRRYREEYQ